MVASFMYHFQTILRHSGSVVLLGLIVAHITISRVHWRDSDGSEAKISNPAEGNPQLSRKQQLLGRHVGILPQHVLESYSPVRTLMPDPEFRTKHKHSQTETLQRLSVHYVWCGKRRFQFQHYLSVMSAVKILHAHQIHFHYDELPHPDDLGYYQYFPAILRDVPQLKLRPVEPSLCTDGALTRHIMQILSTEGGIYVYEEVVLTETFQHLVATGYRNLAHSELSQTGILKNVQGVVIVAPRLAVRWQETEQLPSHTTESSANVYRCVDFADSSKRQDKHACVSVHKEIFPVEITTSSSPVASHFRWLSYGYSKPAMPQPSNSSLVPNIVHYVWFGERTMSFFAYLSLLSAVFVAEADAVFIHGDAEPRGHFWKQAQTIGNVRFINRQFPETVWGNGVRNPSHASDILRADILLRYGGAYADWDVLFVRPIPQRLRQFEFTSNVDVHTEGDFPDVLNFGLILAKPKSRFLQFYLESMKNFVDTDWSYNPIHIPYKIYERHPDLLHLDRHLQVICFTGQCCPSWIKDDKEVSGFKQLPKVKFDWRTETVAFHWTYPDPVEFNDVWSLTHSDTLPAQVGQYILKLSGGKIQPPGIPVGE